MFYHINNLLDHTWIIVTEWGLRYVTDMTKLQNVQ